MPTFQYKAIQPDGKSTTGQIDAGGRQEVFRQIEERGLRLISLTETGGSTASAKPAKAPAPKAPAPKAAAPSPSGGKSQKSDKSVAQTSEAHEKPEAPVAGKISARMLENFTRLLSSLLAAGVPLSRALTILIKEAATPASGGQVARGL